MASHNNTLAVEMKNITKEFPLVKANDNVDFELRWGEVHALIGENGAGKSTLMKILYGLQGSDSGTIKIDGKEMSFKSPKDAIAVGIGMVHQHFMLLEPLTVAENLVLGSEPTQGTSLDYKLANSKTKELIEQFGFDLDPNTKIEDLAVGFQQQVEILKTLYRNAKILIMDEPTAVLTPQETRGLFKFIRDFAESGNAVVFISHKLDEVMEICDRMSVMRDGKMIGMVNREDTDQRKLANMMVGREVILRVDKEPAKPKDIQLELNNVTVIDHIKNKPVVDNVSFNVRAGEIVGIAGIEGNGQTELVELIAGLMKPDSGEIKLEGRDTTFETARIRREEGLSHIPENRYERGLVETFTASANTILGDHYREPFANKYGYLNDHEIEDYAKRLIKDYDVRPRATDVLAMAYSGGNAQKLIVARELERNPDVLIAAQPTRGVDIGAIEFIHKQIVRARDMGLAVLLVSADLNEVMSLSDRILVLYEGRIMGELSGEEATAEDLGLLMAGSKLGEVA